MGENKNPTQCQELLDYMKDGRRVTQISALNDLGIMRLASRISELVKSGYAIEKGWKCGVAKRTGRKWKVRTYRWLGEEEK